ncbi:hypothetical protein HF521_011714, partial [Silurus meridionalis]
MCQGIDPGTGNETNSETLVVSKAKQKAVSTLKQRYRYFMLSQIANDYSLFLETLMSTTPAPDPIMWPSYRLVRIPQVANAFTQTDLCLASPTSPLDRATIHDDSDGAASCVREGGHNYGHTSTVGDVDSSVDCSGAGRSRCSKCPSSCKEGRASLKICYP